MSSDDSQSSLTASLAPGLPNGSLNDDTKVCKVCGDRGIGFNFGVQTCESCKAFFRRNALLRKEFKCPFENQCTITTETRKYCQRCRLIKCVEVGMRKELIQANKRNKHDNSRLDECTNAISKNCDLVLKRDECLNDFLHQFYNDNVEAIIDHIENGRDFLPNDQLLDFVSNRMAYCQLVFHSNLEINSEPPSAEELSQMMTSRMQELNKASLILLPRNLGEIDNQIINLISAFQASESQIISIIKMVKQLESFRKLSIDDQIALLKLSIREILPLWNAMVYDRQTNFFFYYNSVNTQDSAKINFELINQFCGARVASTYKQFVVTFQQMIDDDISIFNLLLAIILFKPRISLPNQELLRTEHLFYMQMLQAYLGWKLADPCKAQTAMNVYMCKLEELYIYGAVLFKFLDNIDTSKVTDFFKEVFNINIQQRTVSAVTLCDYGSRPIQVDSVHIVNIKKF